MTTTSQPKAAFTTLVTRTPLALGKKRTEKLCNEIEGGLKIAGTENAIENVLKVIIGNTTSDTARDLKRALTGASKLVLELMAETWRPRTTPTRADVFYQLKDINYQLTEVVRRARYTLQTTTITT